MKASGMIVGGKVVHCDLPVHNMDDHGLVFRPGEGGRAVSPKTVVDLAVWHWTAGEGEYKQLYKVLDTRELGVEWYIGGGAIYQFCDPLVVDAFAAGKYNPRAVNVEVKNYGFRDKPSDVPKTKRGVRPTFECVQNNRKRTFARFWPEDLVAIAALAKAISAAIPSIPLVVPTGPDNRVYPNYIGPVKMKTTKGHVGHYMFNDEKSDPGPEPLQYLLDQGICQPSIVR